MHSKNEKQKERKKSVSQAPWSLYMNYRFIANERLNSSKLTCERMCTTKCFPRKQANTANNYPGQPSKEGKTLHALNKFIVADNKWLKKKFFFNNK